MLHRKQAQTSPNKSAKAYKATAFSLYPSTLNGNRLGGHNISSRPACRGAKMINSAARKPVCSRNGLAEFHRRWSSSCSQRRSSCLRRRPARSIDRATCSRAISARLCQLQHQLAPASVTPLELTSALPLCGRNLGPHRIRDGRSITRNELLAATALDLSSLAPPLRSDWRRSISATFCEQSGARKTMPALAGAPEVTSGRAAQIGAPFALQFAPA